MSRSKPKLFLGKKNTEVVDFPCGVACEVLDKNRGQNCFGVKVYTGKQAHNLIESISNALHSMELEKEGDFHYVKDDVYAYRLNEKEYKDLVMMDFDVMRLKAVNNEIREKIPDVLWNEKDDLEAKISKNKKSLGF